MSQVSQLSPELARSLLQLARALVGAARNWTLYPPEHPTVASSVARLRDTIRATSNGSLFAIGITPETLLIEGTAADRTQAGIAEAAAYLHDRDLLNIIFTGEPPLDAVHALLRVLALEEADRRQRGGPAHIWLAEGHPSIVLEQIDYGRVMAREEGQVSEPASRDDLWRSIVLSIAGGHQAAFDERAQSRLLAIAGSAVDIADLATAVAAPKCAMDGSPMITSQAATVLAAFRHLTSIVSVMSPDRLPEVMSNMATAATQINPHVVMQLMRSDDDPGAAVAIVKGVAGAFDDMKVAQLLATALALDGQASDRLATIFNTIAPDEDRKRRVLTLTRSMLSETDYGRTGQFETLWTSMEELLVSYNDKPFVSEVYRASLDGVGGRAEKMAGGSLPDELDEWMDTLGQANVRRLSVTMLIDLLTIEQHGPAADLIATDMQALAQDLLLSGAYDDARSVIDALATRARTPGSIGRDGCRQALDRLGDSLALRETAAVAGDLDDETWHAVAGIVAMLGPSSIESLKALLMSEAATPAVTRGEEAIAAFGAAGVSRLASLVSDPRWFVQMRAARLLGRTAAPDAVPLLQPLLRQSDPRVARAAVTALGVIPDAAAARAIHTVLRAATGAVRRAVIEALVAERDPRVVPMLARILEESTPLGKDHEVVLETIAALGTVGTDRAVPALVTMAGTRRFFGGRKLRALKEHSVDALLKVGTPAAQAALEEAAGGDRALKKIVAGRRA